MNAVQKTIEIFNRLGILTDCKKLSTSFNRDSKQWEVWGHFQNANGRSNGRVAQFDTADEAVEFTRLANI